MNRVLPATAIVAAAMFSGATGASAAPPAPLASSAAKDFSQIEKVYDRGTYRVRRYYRYGYDGPVYYRRPAYRYYYGEPYAIRVRRRSVFQSEYRPRPPLLPPPL